MSISVVVENGSIKLPVHVPDGTRVEILLSEPGDLAGEKPGSLAERFAEFIGMGDGLPEDFALNHDHYLHGAPKKE
jgi:hypothetical protein